MTGAQHGGFDYSWLLANLEVAKIPISTDNEGYADVDSLVLGHKAFQAAESYVLGLFHLYFTVYFHKATRSAEQMLTAVFLRLGEMITNRKIGSTGLSDAHPIVRFINERSLDSYLGLDDSVIWGSLPLLKESDDKQLGELASRLLRRDLYKALDVSFELNNNDAAIARFRSALSKAREAKTFDRDEIFEDSPSRNPYKRRGYDAPDALSKVLIGGRNGSDYDDLASRSDVVKALSERKLYRVYARDNNALVKLNSILAEVKQ
jgi:HD superfamily phosphohydrolase